ncbi:MAG: sensor histidine kinase [Rickettsiaceae bacterium]|jgi:two-component system cell cycle sensor histidine kinase PleC|nr:sensor histidine kinase [Rickettsiaceae bacterium]
MLKYFKYSAIVSFLLVLVAAFFAGQYFKSYASSYVIEAPAQERAFSIANNFAQSVVCRYEPILIGLEVAPVGQWDKDKYFPNFKKLSATVLGNDTTGKISLYNKKLEEFFSTREGQVVFFDKDSNSMLAQAQSNGIVSRLITSMGIYDNNNQLQKGSYVRTILAFDTSKCIGRNPANTQSFQVLIDVFDNVTVPYAKLLLFQWGVSFGIVAIFITLYLALFITSRKTEKLINKQHEEKLNLERAKTVAETQNQQKSMFLANVSHELRTPLNAIIGFSEIIKDEVMGPVGHPQYKEYVTDINTSGVHLLSLINDILDYSKAEAKKLDVESVDIDVSKIAHSCMRLVEPRANETKIKLVERLPDKQVVLSADPKRMKQIILNLLSNAVKFTPEGGEVSLTVEEDAVGGLVIVTVVDTGIGIAAKDISKAMSPFGQIDSSISRRYEGTGLGLPLSKKLTELMGGKFEIKSEVGLGTTVILTFPIMGAKRIEDNIDKF